MFSVVPTAARGVVTPAPRWPVLGRGRSWGDGPTVATGRDTAQTCANVGQAVRCLRDRRSSSWPRCNVPSAPLNCQNIQGAFRRGRARWLTTAGGNPHREAVPSQDDARGTTQQSSFNRKFGMPRSGWCRDRLRYTNRPSGGTCLGVGNRQTGKSRNCRPGDGFSIGPRVIATTAAIWATIPNARSRSNAA